MKSLLKHPEYLFAGGVASLAILLSAWNGNVDWMALLLFLFFLVPSFRRAALRLLRGQKGDGCDKQD